MLKVVKATELDGVTHKESDRYVDKRTGLVAVWVESLEDLKRMPRLVLVDPEDPYYNITTSSIQSVEQDGELFKVTTRNTIYFLQQS
jgi:hypothetical protein